VEATISVPRPANETERLAALRRYGRLDASAEKDFDLLTKVAAEICGVPYARISLVDEDYVTGMAGVGMPNGTVPRDEAVCSWAVLQDGLLEIPDLSSDERTSKLRLTTEGGMHMYAGTSLNTKDGYHIGTLCVLDSKPRRLTDHQRELLSGLARQVMALLELRAHERMLEEALAREQHLASVDMLTGLFNRRVLFERFEAELERSNRYDAPLSLVMVDLDHFKAINDKHGHAAGDAVLRSVGDIIRAGIRASDIAGRYGGEELCVVLPHTTAEGAQAFADSLRKQIEAAAIAIEGRIIKVTASMGVAALQAERAEARRILAAADEALYAAKRDGRNRVVLA
jgi:diguanylate cyclase (GGDEF)-like protein